MLKRNYVAALQIFFLLQKQLSFVDAAFVNRHRLLSVVTTTTAAKPFLVRVSPLGVSSDHQGQEQQAVGQEDTPKKPVNELLDAIDTLFPPQGLPERMALSRKDGYWPFIQSGEEPPQEFVYGEFDVTFFCSVLDRARELLSAQNSDRDLDEEAIFCDLGSGTGRLVLAAAAWHSWKLCRGIELLEGIHDQAVEKSDACRRGGGGDFNKEKSNTTPEPAATPPSNAHDAYFQQYNQSTASGDELWVPQLSNEFDGDENEEDADDSSELSQIEESESEELSSSPSNEYVLTTSGGDKELPLSPIQLACGSFEDPYEFFGDSHVIFVFSTAMPYPILVNLARAVGRQCMEGCLVITTEYQLPLGGELEPFEGDPTLPYGPYALELVESFTGPCPSVGGESTVFIHRVTKSYGTGEPFVKPKLSMSDYAYQVVQALDAGALTPDPKTFLRNVSNQMAFIGLPDHWRPKLE
jgi:hypothetical protein